MERSGKDDYAVAHMLEYKARASSYIAKPADFRRFTEIAARIETYWTHLNEAQAPASPT